MVDELKDTYFAEHEIKKGLTKTKCAITSDKLKKAIDKHFNQTDAHIKKIGKSFEPINHFNRLIS